MARPARTAPGVHRTSGARSGRHRYDNTALGVGRSPWEASGPDGRVRNGVAPLPRTCLLSEALNLHLPPDPQGKHPDVLRAEPGSPVPLAADLTPISRERRGACRAGLAADGPAVLEFLTDPAVPPVPPHATREQMQATAVSVLKATRTGGPVIRQGLRAKAQEFLPGREKG